MTDIGTGSYTILAQIAADTLGVPLERVTVALGDSAHPTTAGSGGSFGAASAGGALLDACRRAAATLEASCSSPPSLSLSQGRADSRRAATSTSAGAARLRVKQVATGRAGPPRHPSFAASSCTGRPLRCASRSHSAQSTAFRAAPGGRLSASPRRSATASRSIAATTELTDSPKWA